MYKVCLKCADGLWFSDAPDTRAYLKYVHILYFWIFESGFKIVLNFFLALKQEVPPRLPHATSELALIGNGDSRVAKKCIHLFIF